MRPGLLIVATSIAATLGCGARTDLDVGARDAAAPDAFFFVTFPCRWTLGTSIELARGEAFTELTGAVHPTHELVLVAATERVSGPGATLLTLSGTPAVRLSVPDAPPGAVFGGVDGFVRQDGDRCALTGLDATLAPGPSLRWGDGSCQLTQTRVGSVESVALGDVGGGAVHQVGPLFDDTVAAERIGAVPPTADRAEAVVDADAAVIFVVSSVDGRLSVERRGPAGAASAALVERDGDLRFSSAPDRLRGGLLVLFRGATSAWRLVHLPLEDALAPVDVLDLGELPADPTGQLVTNETEALLPLVDGTLAYVPLARSHLRHLDEPVAGAPAETLRVILRPDDSAGGILYVTRDGAEAVLRYQPLTCNR